MDEFELIKKYFQTITSNNPSAKKLAEARNCFMFD